MVEYIPKVSKIVRQASNLLRRHMRDNGLNLYEMRDKLDVSYNTANAVVKAHKNVSVETLSIVLNSLGFDLVIVDKDDMKPVEGLDEEVKLPTNEGKDGRPRSAEPPIYDPPAIPPTLKPKGFDGCCFKCGSHKPPVQVHGHTQCSNCGEILQSCCDL